jgi:predicted dithiol-disulfide oxidoreductase (DUF899 family)
LFCGKSQLIVYHFMFGPGWKEGCPHCSFWADHFDSVDRPSWPTRHDVRRNFPGAMSWKFKWLASFASDFNFDFCVSFTPEEVESGVLPYNYTEVKMKIDEKEGVGAFYKDSNGEIYHTYSSYARGIDLLNTTYNVLDYKYKNGSLPSAPWEHAAARDAATTQVNRGPAADQIA